jgi:hypothetical protein
LNHPTQIINPETNAIEIHEHHNHRHWHMADGSHVTEHTSSATADALSGNLDPADIPAPADALAARAAGDVDVDEENEPQIVSDITMSDEEVAQMEEQKELQAQLAAAEANYFATGESDVADVVSYDAQLDNSDATAAAAAAVAASTAKDGEKTQAGHAGAKGADAAAAATAADADAADADAADADAADADAADAPAPKHAAAKSGEKKTGGKKEEGSKGHILGFAPMKLFLMSLVALFAFFVLYVFIKKRSGISASVTQGHNTSAGHKTSTPASPEDPGAMWVNDAVVAKPNVSIL